MTSKYKALAVAVIAISICGLSLVLWQQIEANKNSTAQIALLNSQLLESRKLAVTEESKQCAIQSEKVFEKRKADLPPENERIVTITDDSFQNHYNPKMKKCFMEHIRSYIFGGSNFQTTIDLIDPYEMRQWGMLVRNQGKNNTTPKCGVIQENGEQKNCTTAEEFKVLAAQYME